MGGGMNIDLTATSSMSRDAMSVFGDAPLEGGPERRLLLAMLERAILDFVGNDPREVESAATWLFGRQVEDGEQEEVPPTAFSFPWVCEGLDLDAARVAAFIRALPKRGTRRIAPWYFMDRAEVEAVTDRIVLARGMRACGGL
jgi:hypothetical protein